MSTVVGAVLNANLPAVMELIGRFMAEGPNNEWELSLSREHATHLKFDVSYRHKGNIIIGVDIDGYNWQITMPRDTKAFESFKTKCVYAGTITIRAEHLEEFWRTQKEIPPEQQSEDETSAKAIGFLLELIATANHWN